MVVQISFGVFYVEHGVASFESVGWNIVFQIQVRVSIANKTRLNVCVGRSWRNSIYIHNHTLQIHVIHYKGVGVDFPIKTYQFR